MDDLKYWVALSAQGKIGGRTFAKLAASFSDFSKIWSASKASLRQAGLDVSQQEAVIEAVKNFDPDEELKKLEKFNLKAINIKDDLFPALLKEIADPPGVLYVKGDISDLENAFAVVGSRKYSSYGQRVTEEIVKTLAENGLTIVSGLALGIDTLAHRIALEGNTRTIAVLGCGLDQIYPTSNMGLAEKIIRSGGAIISEFPIGMPALRYNFPIRNRIIAGMSLGTLVIEAAADSGSLITAKAALEYNREVFAVPGSIFSDVSFGPNKLIQMGAKSVLCAEDILKELNIEAVSDKIKIQKKIPETKEEEMLLALLIEPKNIDELIKASKLSAPVVSSNLVMMEMKGKVSNLGGTMYQIKGKL